MLKKIYVLTFSLIALLASVSAQEKKDALQLYRQGALEDAITVCQEELSTNVGNMDSYVVLCWSLVRLERYAEAELWATKGRAVNRYDPRIVEILGEIAYFQGKNKEALKSFQDYVTLAPEGGRVDVAYYFMGELYIRLGMFRHADIALSTAVRYVPTNAQWWVRLGYAREQVSDRRFALAAYEKAISLDPQSVDARRGIERTHG